MAHPGVGSLRFARSHGPNRDRRFSQRRRTDQDNRVEPEIDERRQEYREEQPDLGPAGYARIPGGSRVPPSIAIRTVQPSRLKNKARTPRPAATANQTPEPPFKDNGMFLSRGLCRAWATVDNPEPYENSSISLVFMPLTEPLATGCVPSVHGVRARLTTAPAVGVATPWAQGADRAAGGLADADNPTCTEYLTTRRGSQSPSPVSSSSARTPC